MPEDHVLALGDLRLELGGTLTGARLAYRTHGTLLPTRDNAVLFPHMYSGTQTSLDSWIGPGRALDPDRWFVVCPGQLGNGELDFAEHDARPVPGPDDRGRRRGAAPARHE